MHPLLNKNLFLVKEHVGMFKAANNFDIYDPINNEMIMHCREKNLGFFTKMFRFTDYKRMTPFHIEIMDMSGAKILTIKRGVSLFLSKVEVFDEHETLIGRFKQKFFSIGGKFDIVDSNNQVICHLKGKWTSWNFSFRIKNEEFAQVSKKWAGIGREFFTTADNYMLEIKDIAPQNNPVRLLILAAVMCIDMVLKE